jgi:hypothetical protein
LSKLKYNFSKGNFTETQKDLKKYFLIESYPNRKVNLFNSSKNSLSGLIDQNKIKITQIKINKVNNFREKISSPSSLKESLSPVKRKEETYNSILYKIFSALLNWKNQNFKVFYDELYSVLNMLNKEIENINILVDECTIKLFKKFITLKTIFQINKNYQNVFSDKNIKILLSTDHTLYLTIIIVLIVFTLSKKTETFEEVRKDVDRLLANKTCKQKLCPICSKDILDTLINQLSQPDFIYKTSPNKIIDEKKLFNMRRKINDFISPNYRSMLDIDRIREKKQNSDFHTYLDNVFYN